MDRKEVDFETVIPEAFKRLPSPGLLLVAGGENPNPMTIGWISWGIIWGLPICSIYVRPSRHTHGLLEKEPYFTVNIPADGMDNDLLYCGSHSGRDTDKVKACGFSLGCSSHVNTPYIQQCPAHLECRIVHKTKVIADNIRAEAVNSCYGSGDYHGIFHGNILGAFTNSL